MASRKNDLWALEAQLVSGAGKAGAAAVPTRGFDAKQEAWVKERLLSRAEAACDDLSWNRGWSRVVRCTSVITALAVPVLAGAGVTKGGGAGWVPWAILILALFGAIAVGLEQVFHFTQRWRLAEALLAGLLLEGWAFVEGQGAYRDPALPADQALTPAECFYQNGEALLSQHEQANLAEIASADSSKTTDTK